jgi:hypothetical protein
MSKSWKESLTSHANNLEQQANAARVIALADNPLDGIAVAWDLASAEVHAKLRNLARVEGREPPKPPAPISTLLNDFTDAVREKLDAVARILSPSERERLAMLGPSVAESIDAQEPDVIEAIARLVELSPDIIAVWLQTTSARSKRGLRRESREGPSHRERRSRNHHTIT